MAAHLSAFLGYFVLPTIGHILGPLIIWLAKRDTSAFVADQAKESLNMQISVTIYLIIAAVLILLLVTLPLGIALLCAVWLLNLIFVIVAAISAYDGKRYRYPAIFRLVK